MLEEGIGFDDVVALLDLDAGHEGVGGGAVGVAAQGGLGAGTVDARCAQGAQQLVGLILAQMGFRPIILDRGKVVADGPKAGVLDALMKGRIRANEG